MKPRIFTTHFVKLAFVVASISATALAYVVQEGDTLSSIAYRNVSKKVYGDEGSLNKILVTNPQIKNPDLILPGEKIELAVEEKSPSEQGQEATTLPTEVPAAGVEAPNNSDFEQSQETSKPGTRAFVEVRPKLFFTKIDGTDSSNQTNASLLSVLNYGLNFSWNHVMSDLFESFIGIGLAKVEFTKAASKTIDNNRRFQTEFDLGARYHVSDKSTLLASLGAGDELFYRSTSVTNLVLDSVLLPRLNVGIEHAFYAFETTTLGAEFNLKAVGGGKTDNYTIDTGLGYLGRVSIGQNRNSSNIISSAGVYYGSQTQNTSLINLKRTDLGLDFVFKWSF